MMFLKKGIRKLKRISLSLVEILIRFFLSKSVNIKSLTNKMLVFPQETFYMSEKKDIFGEKHKFFQEHTANIPDFFVYEIPNAFCFGNREEIWTQKKELIIDHTTQKINPMKNKKIEFKKAKVIKGTIFNLSLNGLEKNYYHFLTEYLGRLAIIRQASITIDYYIADSELNFQKELLSRLGIKSDQIIQKSNDLYQVENLVTTTLINNWEPVQYVCGYDGFRKIWLPNFFCNFYNALQHESKQTKNIYITRANAKNRKLVNESDIVKILLEFNYDIVDLDLIPVCEQIKLFGQARKIIGLHGAGLTNIFFCKKNTKLLEIFPHGYYDNSYLLQAHVCDINYNYIIGEDLPTDLPPDQRDILLNLHKFYDVIKNF